MTLIIQDLIYPIINTVDNTAPNLLITNEDLKFHLKILFIKQSICMEIYLETKTHSESNLDPFTTTL